MKFHFFNVTNLDEVMMGAKPNVEEVGPYVYDEKREKVNIAFNEDNSEVSYNEKITFTYNSALSGGRSEDDVISSYNLPYVATMGTTQLKIDAGDRKARMIPMLLNGKIMANKVKLINFATVKGFLFGHTQPFLDILWQN